MPGTTVDPCSCVIPRKLLNDSDIFFEKVDSDLEVDSRLVHQSCNFTARGGVFNAPLELVNSVAGESVHGRERFGRTKWLCPAAYTIVKERFGSSVSAFHPDTGAHDEHVTAARVELNLRLKVQLDVTDDMRSP